MKSKAKKTQGKSLSHPSKSSCNCISFSFSIALASKCYPAQTNPTFYSPRNKFCFLAFLVGWVFAKSMCKSSMFLQKHHPTIPSLSEKWPLFNSPHPYPLLSNGVWLVLLPWPFSQPLAGFHIIPHSLHWMFPFALCPMPLHLFTKNHIPPLLFSLQEGKQGNG